jgi:hypothetical protein
VDLLGGNILIINKNRDILNNANKEVGLEIKVERTNYILLSHHQSAGQNLDIKIVNTLFKSQFIYLRMTVTNQNLVQVDINSDNACCHSVQNLLFSRLLSRNLKNWNM